MSVSVSVSEWGVCVGEREERELHVITPAELPAALINRDGGTSSCVGILTTMRFRLPTPSSPSLFRPHPNTAPELVSK